MSTWEQARLNANEALRLVSRGEPQLVLKATGETWRIMNLLRTWGFKREAGEWVYRGREIPEPILFELTMLGQGQIQFVTIA